MQHNTSSPSPSSPSSPPSPPSPPSPYSPTSSAASLHFVTRFSSRCRELFCPEQAEVGVDVDASVVNHNKQQQQQLERRYWSTLLLSSLTSAATRALRSAAAPTFLLLTVNSYNKEDNHHQQEEDGDHGKETHHFIGGTQGSFSLHQVQHLLFLHIVLLSTLEALVYGVTSAISGLVAQVHGAASLRLMHALLVLSLVSIATLAVLLLLMFWAATRYLLPYVGYSGIDCSNFSSYITGISLAVLFESAVVSVSSYFNSFQDDRALLAVSLAALASLLACFVIIDHFTNLDTTARSEVFSTIAWTWAASAGANLILLLLMLKPRLRSELLYPTHLNNPTNKARFCLIPPVSLSLSPSSWWSSFIALPPRSNRHQIDRHNHQNQQQEHHTLLQTSAYNNVLFSKLAAKSDDNSTDDDDDDGDTDDRRKDSQLDSFSHMEIEMTTSSCSNISIRNQHQEQIPAFASSAEESRRSFRSTHGYSAVPTSIYPSYDKSDFGDSNNMSPLSSQSAQSSSSVRSVDVCCVTINVNMDKLRPGRYVRSALAWLTKPRIWYYLRHHALPNVSAAAIKCFGYLIFYLVLTLKIKDLSPSISSPSPSLSISVEHEQLGLLLAYAGAIVMSGIAAEPTTVRVGHHIGNGDSASVRDSLSFYLLAGSLAGVLSGLLFLCIYIHIYKRLLIAFFDFEYYESYSQFQATIIMLICACIGGGCLGLRASLHAVLRGQGRAVDVLASVFSGTWLTTIPLTFLVLLFVGDASNTSDYGNNTSHHYNASSSSISPYLSSSSYNLLSGEFSGTKTANIAAPSSLLSSLLSLIPLVHTQAGAEAVVTGLWASLLLGDLLSLVVAYRRVVGLDLGLGKGLGSGSDWETIEDQCRDRIASRVP